MSDVIRRKHNVSVMIYHFVCPAKYRRVIFDLHVDEVLKETCIEIEKRYEIWFLEIGADRDHVHFLVQSIPKWSATQIIRLIKSITAKQIFLECPEVKKKLWGGELWSDGFYVLTVGQTGSEKAVAEYVRDQGKGNEYTKIYDNQLSFFE
jgi:REP element-mobilizing transposase RayT